MLSKLHSLWGGEQTWQQPMADLSPSLMSPRDHFGPKRAAAAPQVLFGAGVHVEPRSMEPPSC